MRTRTCKSRLKPVALLGAAALGLTAFGYDDGGRYVAETETFSESTSITGDIWIGNDNTGVFTESQAFVWASADGTLNAGATLTGWLRIADWGGTEEKPLYGSLEIQSGSYSAGGFTVGGTTAAYTYSWATLSGGLLTVPSVSVGSTSENAGTATLTLNGGTLATTSVTGTGTLAIGAKGGTFANTDSATISTALTGSGTLTKTGAGDLTISGDVSGFTGKIAVDANSEGYVSITALGVTVYAGDEFQVGAYYWTGAKKDGLWATPGNWSVNGVESEIAPSIDDTVVFSSDASVSFGDTAGEAYDIKVNGTVTFGSGTLKVRNSIAGTGLLRLAGTTVLQSMTGNYATTTISCNVEMVEGTESVLAGLADGSKISCNYFEISGNISGAGNFRTLLKDCRFVNRPYFKFSGTNTGFTGTADLVPAARPSATNGAYVLFTKPEAAFSNASYVRLMDRAVNDADNRTSQDGKYYNAEVFSSEGTYAFGKLSAGLQSSALKSGVVLKVGSLAGETSSITAAIGSGTVCKVGATSTLDLTLTANTGAVEAEEGTTVLKGTVAPASLVFTGTGATIKIANTVGTYEEVVVTEDDPETTEVNEEVKATQFTPYAGPGLSAELANCQIAADTTTEEGYTIYTLAKVATAGETQYYTVADAIEALAEAEDKTITLIRDTTEAVTLPNGYTLVLDGFTAGSVTGASGVEVAYSEETGGTYTTVDNSSSTWQGDAAGANWDDADNWSTGFVPQAGTKIVFEGDAVVFLADNNTYHCAELNIADGKKVTFAPVEYNQANYPRISIHGDVTGTGTVELFRCGLENSKGSTVTVNAAVVFTNEGGNHDSWMTGNFEMNSSLTGTGHFISYDGIINFSSTGSVTVNGDNAIEFMNYPTFAGKSGKVLGGGLNGNGRVVIHAIPAGTGSQAFGRWTYLKAALQNSERWNGTLELNGVAIGKINNTDNGIDAAFFGNANSTVCFNGVSGYLRAGEGVEVGNVKTIEIGANGLTLNNQYTAGAVKNYLIKADLTGTGAIKFGTKHQLSDKSKYVFTGDVSGFTGAINYGDLDSYRACVYFADSSITTSDFGSLTVPTDWGQIIVEEGKTVNVAATWYGAGGWIINGTVNVAATGSLTCDSNGAKIGGSGKINYAAIPSAGLSFNSAWTGTVELAARTGAGAVPLSGLGIAGSKIVVNGVDGTDANSIYLSDTGAINATVELKGKLKLTNGSSSGTPVFACVTGSGDIYMGATGTTAQPTLSFTITKLDAYTGNITLVATSTYGGTAKLTLGAVNVATAPAAGRKVVSIAADNALYNADGNQVTVGGEYGIPLTVAGEATETVLVLKSDGLYMPGSAGYDGGDGTLFSIDPAYEQALTGLLPEGVTSLAETVKGKGMTYAQAFALGLWDVNTGDIADLTSTISIVDGKVVVSLDLPTENTPYTYTCNVYEKASLDADWPSVATYTYVVGNETQIDQSEDGVGFYKVGVTIGNKTASSQE